VRYSRRWHKGVHGIAKGEFKQRRGQRSHGRSRGSRYTGGYVTTSSLWSPALVRILLAQLAFGFSWCLYLVAPKYFTTELAVGPSDIGSIAMTASGASALSVLLVVRSIDRARRRVFICGCSLLALSSLGYLLVQRFGAGVYLLQAGVAASYVLAFNAAMASVTEVVPASRLGQAFGLQSAANLSMNAVSSMTAEHIAQYFGWRWVFALAALSALLALALGFGLPPARQAESSEPQPASPPYLALLPVFLASALLGATYVALAVFHQPYALSLGARQVSSFFVGFTCAALVMRLGFGNLGDRFGRRSVALAACLLYALVVASLVFLDASRLWLYGAGFGVAHGVLYPTLIAFATEQAPTGTEGRTIAAFSGAFNVGAAAGAAGWGALSAQRGYPSLFVAASLCMLAACACLLRAARGAAL
jgi:MFS family permease